LPESSRNLLSIINLPRKTSWQLSREDKKLVNWSRTKKASIAGEDEKNKNLRDCLEIDQLNSAKIILIASHKSEREITKNQFRNFLRFLTVNKSFERNDDNLSEMSKSFE
jgi:hypothetical protein